MAGRRCTGDDRLRAELPTATNKGVPIVATSRDEFIFEHSHNPVSAPLSYPADRLDQREATLTVCQLEQDPRTPIARDRWRYVSASRIEITRPAGFDAGAIYEFIYAARDPIVMGLGFAAVRDFVAFMRHESTDASGIPNPLKLDSGPAVDYVLAYGASQSGRFLRDYLWQGFNKDLNGRRVFDGVLASVAGSRKTFVNFAFAQPGRFSRQHEDRSSPATSSHFPMRPPPTRSPAKQMEYWLAARLPEPVPRLCKPRVAPISGMGALACSSPMAKATR